MAIEKGNFLENGSNVDCLFVRSLVCLFACSFICLHQIDLQQSIVS